MLRPILAIVEKELKVILRDRQALALLFAMPAFFILVMSYALEGVFEVGSRSRPLEVLVVNQDEGPASRAVQEDLKALEGLIFHENIDGQTLTRERAETLVRQGAYPLAIVFIRGFSDLVRAPAGSRPEVKPTVQFIHDPGTNERLLGGIKGMIQAVIQRRVLTAALSRKLADTFGAPAAPLPFPAPPVTAEKEKGLEPSLSNVIGGTFQVPEVAFVSVPPQGLKAGRNPTATEQNVPAYTIFGVFFIVLTLAVSFVQEKKEGTFQRIRCAPLEPAAILIGKLLPYLLVNLIQIALMFFIGVALFGMTPGNIPALLVVSMALALVANGMGLMVASLGRTEAQVSALAVLLAVTLSALGGMMVPAFVMPPALQTLSRFTPHAWALSGYHDVIVRGLGVVQVLPEAGMLLAFAAFFFLIALWRFRFD
jgi:ABC-2 type transport system permease protein